MSTIDLRAEILQLLQKEESASLLERIRALLKREEDADEWDLTDEELAELDAEHEKAVRGEGESYSIEEAMRMAREALKK